MLTRWNIWIRVSFWICAEGECERQPRLFFQDMEASKNPNSLQLSLSLVKDSNLYSHDHIHSNFLHDFYMSGVVIASHVRCEVKMKLCVWTNRLLYELRLSFNTIVRSSKATREEESRQAQRETALEVFRREIPIRIGDLFLVLILLLG